jgi:hypothetical protein
MMLLFGEATQDSKMSLYKYMPGEGAVRLFRSGMLRFTQPIEFNDPFEMQPFLKGLADTPTLEGHFHDEFGKALDPQIDDMLAKANLTAEQKAKIDRRWIHQMVRSRRPQALEMLKMFDQVLSPVVGKQIYKSVNENLGALCLTEKPENLLMWAHYAEHHRGAVIEFDENHEFFNRRVGPQDEFRHFRKVIYTDTRPGVFLNDSSAVDFFYFKSKEWEYEEEWRLIVPLNDCSDRINNGTGLPICLFTVPPACITAVAVGVRMPEFRKLELTRELRTKAEFRHVRVEQVEIDPRMFALHRRIVDPDKIDHWIDVAAFHAVP